MSKRIIKFVLCVLLYCAGCSVQHGAGGDFAGVLDGYGWGSYVGHGTGVWVSMALQELVVVEDYVIVKRYRCSTAAAGAGSVMDSGKTPLGWHRIGAKIGDGLETGAVLKDREWTGAVWQSGDDTEDDLILSRVLWLEGLQEGKNRGGNVDSWNRYIYIHGTNAVNDLGRPASAGCIRLDPQAVIDLYERIDTGCCVLITK